MVVEVGHQDIASRTEADASGGIEGLPHVIHALKTVFLQKETVGGEQLDAMITGIRHDYLIGGVASDVPGIVELTALASFLSEHHDKSAVHFEDLQKHERCCTQVHLFFKAHLYKNKILIKQLLAI